MENLQQDPAHAQRTATLIGLSLALGVTLYAGVTWYLHQTAETPRSYDPGLTRVLIYAWIGLTAVTSSTALFFWRTRVDPMIAGSDPLSRDRMPQLTANLLICWAVIESASLFGVTVYFISGVMWVAAVAVVLIWVAFLATRPQIDWYERFR